MQLGKLPQTGRPVMDFERNKKIGILGGTFNPPHNGHYYLAKKALEEFSLDEVLLLPVGLPPHKMQDPVLGRELRRRMVELLAEMDPRFRLCTMELERDGYTYTIDTLRAMRRQLGPGTELYYIIGTDTLFELPTWKEYEQVFSYTTFLCFPRPGDSIARVRRQIAYYQEKFQKTVLLSRHLGPEISSTEIREMFVNGEPLDGLVPDAILEFMEKNHVFR